MNKQYTKQEKSYIESSILFFAAMGICGAIILLKVIEQIAEQI